MNPPFTFNSKETYLQYRNIWRQKYAALSQVIRDCKFCRKSTIGHTPKQLERYEATRKAHANQFGFWPQSLCLHYRKMATEMLEELKMAKVEAARQYAEKHSQLAAAQ